MDLPCGGNNACGTIWRHVSNTMESRRTLLRIVPMIYGISVGGSIPPRPAIILFGSVRLIIIYLLRDAKIEFAMLMSSAHAV